MSETDTAAEQRLIDPEVIEDPFPLYQSLHSSCPVKHDDAIGWIVTRYGDMRSLLLKPNEFSSERAYSGPYGPVYMGVSPEPLSPDVEELLKEYHPLETVLFKADPPAHTRHRALINKALNPRRVRQLEPSIQEIATDLVDRFAADGHAELHQQFSIPLPLTVIADTLGIDRKDLKDFKYWSDCMVAGDLDVLDNARRAEVARGVIEFHKYMVPLIEARREQPTDDLLSDITNAELDLEDAIDGPRRFRTSEILPLLGSLLLAGNETTTNLIGNAMVVLLNRPELMAEVRGNYELIPTFIEEVLRYDSPVQCTYRRPTADTECAGQPMAENDMVAVVVGAGNQDAEMFENPRTFDMHRPNVRRHLAFGAGPHFCVGSELARIEARVAFETLFNRLDDIRLAPGAELKHHPSFAIRGFQQIPIEFTERTAA
jgi:cytochrome P450